MRKVLLVVAMGLVASLGYVPAASADPAPFIQGGGEIDCDHGFPFELDWNLVVGPQNQVGDFATIILDGVRTDHADLGSGHTASGEFNPIDSRVSHTVVFTWFDSLSTVIATDTIVVNTPPTCKVARPTATVDCKGLVLGNAEGSREAEFLVVINGLQQEIELDPHQASLNINTVKDGDFIRVLTLDWEGDFDVTLIQTHLTCAAVGGGTTTTGPTANVLVTRTRPLLSPSLTQAIPVKEGDVVTAFLKRNGCSIDVSVFVNGVSKYTASVATPGVDRPRGPRRSIVKLYINTDQFAALKGKLKC